MKDKPTVTINGEVRTVRNDTDVRDIFEAQSGFNIEASVGELTVDTIDSELDYNSKHEHYVLRCYVYFTPLEGLKSGTMGSVNSDDLAVSGWKQDKQMVGDRKLSVVYTKAIEP